MDDMLQFQYAATISIPKLRKNRNYILQYSEMLFHSLGFGIVDIRIHVTILQATTTSGN